MATNTGGWLYEATGTPVDKATADNAQARVLEIKQAATTASTDATTALSRSDTAITTATAAKASADATAAGQAQAIANAAQAKSDATTALVKATGAVSTADNAADRVDALEVMGGVQPGSVNDAEMRLHAEQDGGLFNTALKAQIAQRAVLSTQFRRVFATDNPAEPLAEGDLHLTVQGPRAWTEQFVDGLYGMTPRWARRGDWTASEGAVVLPIAGLGTPRRALSIDALGTAEQDVELLGKVRRSGIAPSLHCGLIVRGSGMVGSENGYGLALLQESVVLNRYNNGAYTAIQTWPFPLASNTDVWLRFRVDGEQVSAKAWLDGAAEPTEWLGTYSAATVPGPGWAGLLGSAPTVAQTWALVAVATQGETAVAA